MGSTPTTSDRLLEREVMARFPKVELHRHLEGTFFLPTLHTIALKNSLPFPKDFGEFKKLVQFPKGSPPDFLKFLSLFKNDWYQSFDDIEAITYASVKALADDGLFYVELRFSPEHFSYHNNFKRDEVTRLIVRTANRAAKELGFYIRYLITFNRSKQNQNEMLALYELIRDLELPGIVGIDLAGDEINYPPQLFAEFFSRVNQDGIYGATVHAGEVTSADQIWDAIDLLGAGRIGHGVSAIDDEELQLHLISHSIALEQCITSNYQTGSWMDEPSHPVGRLHRANVPVTINSDDPSIQDTDLTDDYIKTVKYFAFGVDDLVAANLRAIQASFLSDTEKKNLTKRYRAAVSAFRESQGL